MSYQFNDSQRIAYLEQQLLRAAYQSDIGECFSIAPGKGTVRDQLDSAMKRDRFMAMEITIKVTVNREQ